MTLEQWFGTTGSGTYNVEDDTATLSLTFRHLIPNGTYTLLAPRITVPPHFKIRPIPGGDIAGASFRLLLTAMARSICNSNRWTKAPTRR